MFPDLMKYPYFAYDTETTGVKYPVDRAFGLSVATPDGLAYYWDLRREPNAISWFKDQIKHYKGTIICHNASFDARMVVPLGIHVPLDRIDCTMIRACLIDEHLGTWFPWTKRIGNYGLDYLGKRYLQEGKIGEIYEELAAEFGGLASRNVQMPNLHKAPVSIVAPYAIQDAKVTLKLWEWQESEIETQGIEQIVQFERSTIPTVIRTELHGVRVSVDSAAKAQVGLSAILVEKQLELDIACGKPLNVNSTPQIRAIFKPTWDTKAQAFVTEAGAVCDTTPKGNPSINSQVLQSMGDPRADLITEIRSIIRTRDTFLQKHVIDASVNGRVYPNINQVAGEDGGTKTGRFSYTDPALQQIPNRNKDVAAQVKPCFLPDEGQVWVDRDLNSFEVRVFAHLVAAYNRAIADIYAANPDIDFHAWVADLMGVPRNPQPNGGANAKQLNLSMIFNSGKGAIAEKLGLPWNWEEFETRKRYGKGMETIRYRKAGQEALKVIGQYHARVQGVSVLADRCKSAAEERGFIKTMYGRRLRFPKGYKSYKASGLLIQATSADINKENWCLVEDALGSEGRMLLNTHDSYSMSMPEDRIEVLDKRVVEAVERDILRVPLKLDLSGIGSNWWEAIS